MLVVLTGNIIFMSSSYTMLIPFLPMYLTHELGVDQEHVNLWSGIVFSASFLMSAVMAPIWGRLADTRGKRAMAIRASFLLSVSYFLGGLVRTPTELAMMRLFQGFAAGLWPMDLAIMTLYAPPQKLGFSIGIMQGALTAGGVIGPLLGGVLAEAFGMRVSFFIASGALFLNFLAFVFIIKEPPDPSRGMKTEGGGKGMLALLSVPVIRGLLLCSSLVQMVILILQPILTTYISSMAGDIENIIFVSGLVFSLGGFAGAMTAPLWGILGQRRGYFTALGLALPLAGTSMLIQGTMPDIYSFAAMQFTGGLFFSGIHPSINALLAKNTDSRSKGRIFGLMFAAQQIGSILGPVIGGAVATYLGMHCVFFAAGAALLGLRLYIRTHRDVLS